MKKTIIKSPASHSNDFCNIQIALNKLCIFLGIQLHTLICINIVSVELGRVGENTRYDHVCAGLCKDVSRDINFPSLTCVKNQTIFYINIGHALLDSF